MKEKQLASQLGFFKSLKETILKTLEKLESGKISPAQFFPVAQSLYDSYDRERIHSIRSMDFVYIDRPKSLFSEEEWYGTLHRILLECDKAIAGLESEISPLSGTQVVQLEELRRQLEEMLVGMENVYEKNMNEAIKECENGNFLGSSLISSRVIAYIFDQILGERIEDKVRTLKGKGVVEEKGEIFAEFVMKADKKARNYLSHNLSALPDCGEALELLGICSRLLKVLVEYKKTGALI